MSRKIRHTRADIIKYLEGEQFTETGTVKVVVTFHDNGKIRSQTFDVTVNKNWLKMILDMCKQYDIQEYQILQIVRSSNI